MTSIYLTILVFGTLDAISGGLYRSLLTPVAPCGHVISCRPYFVAGSEILPPNSIIKNCFLPSPFEEGAPPKQ
jgi:hypothetical protein